MKKIKYIIIALIVLLIILVSLLFFLTNELNIQSENNQISEEKRQDIWFEAEEYSVKEENANVYFSINDLIEELFTYVLEGNNNAIYGITDVNYSNSNNINTENIKSIYPTNISLYNIQEVYKLPTYENAIYYTHGYILQDGGNVLQDYYLKVKVDFTNNTFAVLPLELEEYTNAKNGKINQFETINITKNEYNTYNSKSLSSEEMARRNIKDYILKAKYMPEVAFNLLDDEYRNQKFSNVDEFKKYVQNNGERFDNFVIKSYEINIEEEYIQYNVTDIYENKYQVKVYSPLEYKIILDNYTIETEEYVQKYNEATEENKVATCIYKFFKLVNAKEYSNAYKYLDNTFKQNNFNTYDKFEEYAKNTFFNNNVVEIKSEKKIGEVYSCQVNIKSGNGVSAQEKELTVILMLQEGTDFVMSFSVQ